MAPLVDWYFEVCRSHAHNKKMIVLIQVGGFYEAYTDARGNGSARIISELLKIHLTRKNTKKELGCDNPYMAGFPLTALQKYLTRLNDEGYEVMIIEQQDDNPKKRFVRGIYNDCMRMEFEDDDCNENDRRIYCILIEKYVQGNAQRGVTYARFHISSVIVEMNTGRVFLDMCDTDEVDRSLDAFVLRHEPQRVLVTLDGCTKDVCAQLEKACTVSYDDDGSIKQYDEIYYFRKAFSIPETEDDAIVYLGLHRHQSLVQCLGRLLRWVQRHDPLLMEKLRLPEFLPSEDIMGYNQDALTEFHIMSVCDKRRYAVEKQKQKSLFDILSSSMNIIGKRHLKRLLSHPIVNVKMLQERYALLDRTIERGQSVEQTLSILRTLCDIEWYLLRWKRNKLTPRLIAQLLLDYENLAVHVHEHAWPDFFDTRCLDIVRAVASIRETWDLEKMATTTGGDDVLSSFILDKDASKMSTLQQMDDKLASFEAMVPTGKLILDKEKRYLIQLTPRSWKLGWDKTGFYEVEKKTSFIRVSHPDLDKLSNSYFSFMSDFTTFYKNHYEQTSQRFLTTYGSLFEDMNERIARFSCLLPLARFFYEKNYHRPTIDTTATTPFLECIDARHAIMESIHPDHLFVPYSVVLGREKSPRGFLIYGINSSGKSTMLKSVGLCLWLAQCGFYVPATSMSFSPFDAVYTKIGIQDNLFLGHSTFVAEMNELLYIMKRSSQNSFIMCDELTSGTETKSASGLVASTLFHFLENKQCFLFTTHLHTIAHISEIAKHPALRMCHFRIETQTDNLLVKNIRMRYDRHLYDGSGDDMYGIEIAKNVGLPLPFIQRAFSFRERIKVYVETDTNESVKVSRYNKKKILTSCFVCGSDHNLHTHHITPQHEFEKREMKHVSKNGLFNLVTLCQKCHHTLHGNEES